MSRCARSGVVEAVRSPDAIRGGGLPVGHPGLHPGYLLATLSNPDYLFQGLVMYQIDDLLHLMARLRDPQYGCPWDLKQTYATIVPYTLEEAYEVADAHPNEIISNF